MAHVTNQALRVHQRFLLHTIEIDVAAREMLDKRMEMIERKNACRDNLQTVLSDAQFAQVVEMYKAMMP